MFRESVSLFAFFLSLLLLPQYVAAQEAATKSYEGKENEASAEIQERFEKAVVPFSNSLAYLLTTTLPEEDGRPRPLGIRIEPTDPINPDEPVQIVFSCYFGRVACKPFFEACTALNQKCTGDQ